MTGRFLMVGIVVLAAAAGGARGAIPEPASEVLLSGSSWRRPAIKDVRAKALAWIERAGVDPERRAKAESLWADAPERIGGEEVLTRLAATFALADENARKLVDLCSKPRTQPSLPPQPWLADANGSRFELCNLRLLYGVWLAQQCLFEESLEQLADLKPDEVVDPASLLFYQAVGYHRLLQKDRGLKAARALLEKAEESPRRYVALARLIEGDLESLDEDSLDHIARRMSDIQRRLDLGRAGPKVRKIEDGVIESLDKLIKKLEEQQRQQQAGAGGGSMRPSSPASDSRIMGGKGPGEVTKKDVGSKAGWGDLPPKQREEAMQQISREFPAHYRDVIEQYFRRLAGEGSDRP